MQKRKIIVLTQCCSEVYRLNTERINRSAKLIGKLTAGRLFRDQPLCLVDVGASGGIEDYWRQFEPDLVVYGFEPMVEECARLKASEKSASVRYFDSLLGCDRYEELFPSEHRRAWSDFPFSRTSAGRAQQLLSLSYAEMVNVSQKQTMSQRFTTLDRFFGEYPTQFVDFMKIDTDGHDYEVLLGGRGVLRDRQVLGLLVEVPFHGVSHPHSQLFSNIDRFLRENGFSLFDIEAYRYSRAALPDIFTYDQTAQTPRGQVIAADALYFRDLCAPGYQAQWSLTVGPNELLKLACLLELYGMPDCAAEVLTSYGQSLQDSIDVAAALDLLAQEMHGSDISYRAIYDRFETDPRSFFRRAHPLSAALGATNLRAELEAMRNSKSWRITKPLRALNRLVRRYFMP